MKRTSFADWPCSIARTVGVIGEWWTPLVLREACYGTTRFDDFQRALGIGRNVLTQRLVALVDAGILERVPYQERPPRHEYHLTDKGRDLFPVLAAVAAWGDRWLTADEGPPVVLHHQTCGHDTTARVVCDQCGDDLRLDDVTSKIGPGFPPRHRTAAVQSGRFAAETAG